MQPRPLLQMPLDVNCPCKPSTHDTPHQRLHNVVPHVPPPQLTPSMAAPPWPFRPQPLKSSLAVPSLSPHLIHKHTNLALSKWGRLQLFLCLPLLPAGPQPCSPTTPNLGLPASALARLLIATAAGRFLGPASDQATLPKAVRWLPTRWSQSHPALMPRRPRMIWPQSPSFPFLNYTPTRQSLPRPHRCTQLLLLTGAIPALPHQAPQTSPSPPFLS